MIAHFDKILKALTVPFLIDSPLQQMDTSTSQNRKQYESPAINDHTYERLKYSDPYSKVDTACDPIRYGRQALTYADSIT